MHKLSRLLIISVGVLLLIASVDMLSAQVTFTVPDTNKYTQLGLRFRTGNLGTAWGDYDGDGDMDVFMGGGGMPSGLFKNDLNTDGHFTKVSKDSANMEGVLFDTLGYTLGGVWADFNGDDLLDLMYVNVGIALWLNNGTTFDNASAAAGIAAQLYTSGSGTFANLWQIAVGDYDRDGDLDFTIAGGDGSRQIVRIYQNNGGVFTNVASEAIGFDLSLESWNPQWVDMDNDGDLDLFMPTIRTNSGTIEPCAFLINQGNGEFNYADSATTPIHVRVASAIASTWADIDNDCDMDLFTIPHNNTASGGVPMLLRNDGVVDGFPTFTNIISGTGLDSTATDYEGTRGMQFGDFDNDGDNDLLIGNIRAPKKQRLFRNDGDNIWVDVAGASGVHVVPGADYRSVCFVDYDNDGWLDLWFMGCQAADTVARKWLLHNEGGTGNHWIGIKPHDAGSMNTAAIGAYVRTVAGSLNQIRDIQAGGGGGIINGNLRAHFGLGSATMVDSVIVRWSTGAIEVATNIPADKYYIFEEGAGISSIDDDNPVGDMDYKLYQNYPNPFNPVTTIEFNLATKGDIQLELVNILGQVVKVLAKGSYPAGPHKVSLDATNLAAGVYFYRLQAPDFKQVKKLVILK